MPIIIKNPWRYLVFVGGRDFWTRSQGQEYGLICSTEKHVMRGDVQVFEIDKKNKNFGHYIKCYITPDVSRDCML